MYIVTGGSGLIGSAIVWALNKQGIDNILIVDHLGNSSDKWKNLRALKFADYMEKDQFRTILQENKMPRGLKGIVHMGACSSTTERDASYLMDNNFNVTKELAEYSAGNNIRFIYASSAATYGDGAEGYLDNEDEIEKLRPLNAYGYSKQIFDLWALRKGLLNKITGLKFFNIYGPGELHKGEMRSVVHRAFEQIRDTKAMKLFKSYKPEYADGEQKRDFLYVKDAASMVLFLLHDPEATGIYNIGSGKAETWNSLVNAAFEAMNVKPNFIYIDMPEQLRDRYQYFTEANMEKFNNLGYDKEPRSLKDAVKDYIQNYLQKDKYLGDE